ncbi:hypothetical protein M405DRAFT_856671 [Rhizopogon salebrosus TDB-379]|nr:hypothetical protein M405DRAFT_856671 [Rhizopogon salebrosus TDB-379]
MSRTPGIIQNTSLPSTSSNLKSDPHAINTFPAIIEPLKVFNSVADEIADFYPYAKSSLSISTCASEVHLVFVFPPAHIDDRSL